MALQQLNHSLVQQRNLALHIQNSKDKPRSGSKGMSNKRQAANDSMLEHLNYPQTYESMIYEQGPDISMLSGQSHHIKSSNQESLKNMHKAINNSVIIESDTQIKKKTKVGNFVGEKKHIVLGPTLA